MPRTAPRRESPVIVRAARARPGYRQIWDEEAKAWIEYKAEPGPLDVLLRAGKIGADAFTAGLRFQTQFERAQLGPRYAALPLDAIRVDGGPGWREPIGGNDGARREIEEALAYVNGRGAAALQWILGMGESIEAFAMGLPVHERAIGFMLICALDTLAAFYAGGRSREAA